ncbi:MAG: hypothetical protein ACRDDH_18275 [Cetobacterium sp.]|uniref:hypothetical protein n=1 Tax=Cetobacterium sp. TaxID=2071632 RepID=UPI003EE4481E
MPKIFMDYLTGVGVITNIYLILLSIVKFYETRSYKTQNRIKGLFLMVDLYRAVKTGLAFNENTIVIIYKNNFTKYNFLHGIKINFLLSVDMVKTGKFMSDYFIKEHCFDKNYIIMRFKGYVVHKEIEKEKTKD